MDETNLEQLLLKQPLQIQEMDAVKVIAKKWKNDLYFSIMLAISYGIILGKREERARRNGKQS